MIDHFEAKVINAISETMTCDKCPLELVEAVQSVGKELINRADDIVGHKDLTTGFNISIDIDSERGACVPCITVTQSYISESVLKM